MGGRLDLSFLSNSFPIARSHTRDDYKEYCDKCLLLLRAF